MLHILVWNSQLLICVKFLFILSEEGSKSVKYNDSVPWKRMNRGFSFQANRCITFYISVVFVYAHKTCWFRYIESRNCSGYPSWSFKSSPDMHIVVLYTVACSTVAMQRSREETYVAW